MTEATKKRSNKEMTEDKPNRPEYKNDECLNCGKERHFTLDCPELSYKEKKTLKLSVT